MRRVLYISGSRADYGPARRVLQAIGSAEDFELGIIVTGMHLDPVHGETWREIQEDGFTIAERIYGRVTGDSLATMAASVGLFLYGMSLAMSRLKPDIVVVLGDRGEQLAGAMAAAFQNIAVVHLCGGSISGSIDDSIRHAITKFSHYHLAAFEEHANRIVQMGEDPAMVRVVGLPGGNIKPDVTYSRDEICDRYRLPHDKPYILVVQHSVTHSQAEAGRQVTETLEALAGLSYPTLLANPNDDSGGRELLTKMHEYAGRCPHMRILPPPRSRELFSSIMAHAGVLVGNSSSGIVEAMSVGLPVVNIGDRQRGREHLACLLNVGYAREEIRRAVFEALHGTDYRDRLASFAERVASIDTAREVLACLRSLDLQSASRPKPFRDFCFTKSTG